jgi:hypothetical protein
VAKTMSGRLGRFGARVWTIPDAIPPGEPDRSVLCKGS